jgi:inorganic phosphate transporter, PiT family
MLLPVVAFLAYSNGANDNFKGVASLFGSGTADFKTALGWATACTLAGSLVSVLLAERLLKNFSGYSIVPDTIALTPEFAFSVALGTAITVFLATKIGMPISTTHGIIGSLTGCAFMLVGTQINLLALGTIFLLPLLLSPVLAAILSMTLYVVFRYFRIKSGIEKSSCACIGMPVVNYQLAEENSQRSYSQKQLIPVIGNNASCEEFYSGKFIGINAQKVLDVFHFASAGVVSFARGLNDTPKILGLLAIVTISGMPYKMLLIGIMMALGGLFHSSAIAKTMGKKIAPLNSGQGFTANLVTSLLVTGASVFGMPVSTTHVTVGSIFGIGGANGTLNKKKLYEILFAWVLVLPISAIVAGSIYKLITL